jgi:hypothetical protein
MGLVGRQSVRTGCRFFYLQWLAKGGWACHFFHMSMAEVMREIAGWPRTRQNKLAAYLLHLRLQGDSQWRSEMTRRIDDSDSKKWVRLEDLKKSLKRRRAK